LLLGWPRWVVGELGRRDQREGLPVFVELGAAVLAAISPLTHRCSGAMSLSTAVCALIANTFRGAISSPA
jgi:hypothetical protein